MSWKQIKTKTRNGSKNWSLENLRLKKRYIELQLHSMDEVNDLLGDWYKSYNFDRPHSSLKYKTPAAFENLKQKSLLP
jgi:transposase InsO family protein